MPSRIVASASFVEYLAQDLSRASRHLEDLAHELAARRRRLASQGIGTTPEGRQIEVRLAVLLPMLGQGSENLATQARALRRYAEDLHRSERGLVVLPVACMPALPGPLPLGRDPRATQGQPMGMGCNLLAEGRGLRVVPAPLPLLVPDRFASVVKTPGGRTGQRKRHPALDSAGGRLRHLPKEVKAEVEDAIRRALADDRGRFPKQDGKEFENHIENGKRLLPARHPEYYREWTAASSGDPRGQPRVIVGGDPTNPDVIYYWSHAKQTRVIKIWP